MHASAKQCSSAQAWLAKINMHRLMHMLPFSLDAAHMIWDLLLVRDCNLITNAYRHATLMPHAALAVPHPVISSRHCPSKWHVPMHSQDRLYLLSQLLLQQASVSQSINGGGAEMVNRVSRCSEVQVAAATVTSPAASLLTPLNTSKVADSPASTTVAPMSVVRQALEAALLQDNDEFWVQNPPDLTNCVPDAGRRNQQAMQVYLRLYILVASKGQANVAFPACPFIYVVCLSICHTVSLSI